MKTSLSKKEIRCNLEAALISEIEKMEGSESSKKLKRAVRKVSRDIAPKVKFDMKKKRRKNSKGLNIKTDNGTNSYLMNAGGEKVDNGHA